MTRYVIARQERGEFLAGPVVPVLELPDAEHIHLARRADGSIESAVPMQPRMKMGRYIMSGCLDDDGTFIARSPIPGHGLMWVDAPEQGDERG